MGQKRQLWVKGHDPSNSETVKIDQKYSYYIAGIIPQSFLLFCNGNFRAAVVFDANTFVIVLLGLLLFILLLLFFCRTLINVNREVEML